jgi:hypothetical protein
VVRLQHANNPISYISSLEEVLDAHENALSFGFHARFYQRPLSLHPAHAHVSFGIYHAQPLLDCLRLL